MFIIICVPLIWTLIIIFLRRIGDTTLIKENTNQLNYVDLLSLIEETNRCPGGKRTINKVLQMTMLGLNEKSPKILEVGSNTGFTSIEIAKLISAEITGIDVNKNAVAKAQELLSKEDSSVQLRVNFQVGDASTINFPNDYFDLVITGGANTFIDEKSREAAIKEYRRVLKPNGFLSITNLFYNKKVPNDLLKDLKNILGFDIYPWRRAYWLDLFLSSDLELYSYSETPMESKPNALLKKYVHEITRESLSLEKYDRQFIKNVENRWFNIMEVFNRNHHYLSFMTVLLRKSTVPEQWEFFIEKDALDIHEIKSEGKFWI